MKRLHVALFALLVVQFGVAAPSPRSAAAPSVVYASTGYCADAEDIAFLQLINNYRAQNGLGPLVLSQKLADASYYHSSDMAAKNYFSHTFADGTTWDQNIRNFGYTYNTSLGENIAAGYSTASSVFTAWRNSAGHNANMLTAGYTAIGIARAYSSSSTYGWYWTTDFGGVVDGAGAICGDSPAPTATPTQTPTLVPTATKTSTPMAPATKTATPKATATKTPTPKPATPTATNAPVATSYVAGLLGSSSSGMLSITATIKDSTGRYVSGAAVTIAVTSPNGAMQTLSTTTDSRGQAKVKVAAADGAGIYRVSIVDVSAANRPYDPSRDRTSGVSISVR